MDKVFEFKIFKGLPATLIDEAASIYYAGFSQKIKALVGSREKAMLFIKNILILMPAFMLQVKASFLELQEYRTEVIILTRIPVSGSW